MDALAGGHGQADPLALHLGLGQSAGKQEVWRWSPGPAWICSVTLEPSLFLPEPLFPYL